MNEKTPANVVDKSLIVFKVQIGIFKGAPPEELKAKYDAIGGVKRESTITGLTRYIKGEFNDYKAASKLKEEIAAKGIPDAFVIAFFNGQYITVQEALELSK